MSELNALSHIATQHLDKFRTHFGLTELKDRGDKFVGCCPVHGGDNRSAFNLYKVNGYWKCRTHACHEIFYPTVIGLIRGLLSKQELNWSVGERQIYPFIKTVAFMKQVIGEADYGIELKPIIYVEKTTADEKYNDSIEEYKKKFLIPCPFYSKKFKPEILEKHMVGFCSDHKSKMYLRTTVPILSIDKQRVIGYTGRSIFKKCPKCGYFHNSGTCWDSPKWYHDFFANDSLYNIWNLKGRRRVFLTESIGNVFRMEEAGIGNAAALYGCYISNFRKKLLLDAGITDILMIRDNDEAGLLLKDRIIKEWREFFRIRAPIPKWEDDIAELNFEKVKEFLNV